MEKEFQKHHNRKQKKHNCNKYGEYNSDKENIEINKKVSKKRMNNKIHPTSSNSTNINI